MSYSSRKRYTSRREKSEKIARNIKVMIVFALLALAVILVKKRHEIWDHLQTYFY